MPPRFCYVWVGLVHLVLWKWFSSILPQFLGCLGVLVPGVCVCSLLSVVLYTRISAVLLSPYRPCAWVHCISCNYSLEYVYVVFGALCP